MLTITTGECYIFGNKLAVGTDMSFKLHLASTFCIPDVSVQEISPIVMHAARCTRSHHLTYSYHFFQDNQHVNGMEGLLDIDLRPTQENVSQGSRPNRQYTIFKIVYSS